MLINLRNALMAGKRLPYDAEVEYLESSGTQWIDTGVKFTTDNARVKFTASVDYERDMALCGSQNHSAENNYGFVCYLYNNAMRVYAGTTNTGATSSLVDGNVHTVDLQANSGTLTKTIDGTISTANYSGTIVSGEDFTIFTSWSVASSSMTIRCVKGKICSFQIWNNGVLVRDFIPVRKGTVGYLYDRVSGKLFGNEGTGDFVLGPDVVPVEYIESHGTEWIDTEINAKQSLKIRAVFEENSTTSHFVYGVRAGDSTITCASGTGTLANLGFARWGTSAYAEAVAKGLVDITQDSSGALVNGKRYSYNATQTVVEQSGYTMVIFAGRNSTTTVTANMVGKFYSCEIWDNGTPVRSFLPVRVGNGSTWEGAMMDVLTRRIYRNAGTGAFTYGNDLRYPIPAA